MLGSLNDYLLGLPPGKQMKLQVFQTLEKDAVLSLQADVAQTIADTFDALMPLYAASMKR